MRLRSGETLAGRLQAEGVHPALVIRVPWVPKVVGHTIGTHEITFPLTVEEQATLSTEDFILRPYLLLRPKVQHDWRDSTHFHEWDTAMDLTGVVMMAIFQENAAPD